MGMIGKAAGFIKANGFMNTLRFVRHRIVLDIIQLLSRTIRFDTSKEEAKTLIDDFIAEVNKTPGSRILEIGSRDISRKDQFTNYGEYVGFDIHPGNFVDVVGDAHRLSDYFPPDHFDAVYCISVFEHLAMPWKAVTEINKVLKPGGRLLIATHPTYPPHAQPWDFWRFSRSAFSVLLNRNTGFEISEWREGLPCIIMPLSSDKTLRPAFHIICQMLITVIAKKTDRADANLGWPIQTDSVTDELYPLQYSERVSNQFFAYLLKRKNRVDSP